MSAAGYSGTPLLKKLGVKDGMRALLVNAPAGLDALNKFSGWKSAKRAKTMKGAGAGPYDYIHYFSNDLNDYKAAAPAFKKLLEPAGMVWISWPKKSSGVATTLGEADVRALGLKAGLVDIKICAVDETWSGLKFVIPVKDRKK
ncbi:MAG: hypothetical protein R3C60_02550 [Parvularculaceae bacterium]